MKQDFTDSFKEMIRQAREVAIELRAGYISTLHFFLAECKNDKASFGIRSFLFPDKARFQQYYEALLAIQQYYCPGYSDPGDLPLLKEAERAIFESFIEQKKFGHAEVIPAHLFLAAVRDAGSELNRAITQKEDLYDRLLSYYMSTGLMDNPYPDVEEEKQIPGYKRKLALFMQTGSEVPELAVRTMSLIRMDGVPGDRSLSLQGDNKTALLLENLQQKESEPGVYAVQLGEKGGKRKVLIELSAFEAHALAFQLEMWTTDRPLTHRLMYDTCLAMGYQLQEIIFHTHMDDKILAQVCYIKGSKILIQDIQAADAIILSAMSHAPIFIAEKVFRMFAFTYPADSEKQA